jgi:YD repeat-containing protein
VRGALLCVVLLACDPARPPEVAQPEVAVEPNDPKGDGGRSREVLPIGATMSPPRSDWPCEIDAILGDGGDTMLLQPTYGARRRCAHPADLVTSGVIGCPEELRAYRVGYDHPRYVLRYGYDEAERLVSIRDGDAEPTRVAWGADLVLQRSSDTRVYAASADESGFEVRAGDEVVVTAVIGAGRLVGVERRYPALTTTLSETVRWQGARVVEIRSGGDVLTPRYDCSPTDRSGWEKPD